MQIIFYSYKIKVKLFNDWIQLISDIAPQNI
jgi:hypothetical protein